MNWSRSGCLSSPQITDPIPIFYGPSVVGFSCTVIATAGRNKRKFGEVALVRGSLLLAAGSLLWISLLSPAVTSLISRRSTVEQGFTMGWSNAVISLGRIAGPAVGGFAYDAWIEAPFALGASLLLFGFIAQGAGGS